MRVLLPQAFLLVATRVLAGDAIVTLQYENPNARVAAGTSMLAPATLQAVSGAFPNVKGNIVNEFRGQIGKLPAEELAKNYTDACRALGQLGNGALLVLNCHSSSEQVGVPTAEGTTTLVPWGEFWGHFQIPRPPRLALVVLNGCVGAHGTAGESQPPTAEDLERVRCAFHAEGLISGRRNIATEDSQAEIVNLFRKLKAEEGQAGKGWEVRLDGPGGPMAPLRILALRTGRLVDEAGLSVMGLKRSAVEFGRPGEVVSAEERDTVGARPDDAHISVIALSEPVQRFDTADLTTGAAMIPFRFEFRPRGEIVGLELEIRVRVVAGDARADRWVLVAGGHPATLKTDFSAFAGKDGDAKLSFPSAEATRAHPGARLSETDPVLHGQLMTGRLRCAVGPSLRVLSARAVVRYATK